jgi:hypothetical protein
MRIWGIGAVLALGMAATAAAGPVDFKQVSAAAKWVVHFDVDAMRQSTLVQRTYEKCVGSFPNAEARLRETTDLVEHLGIDLSRDLHGLTAYGMKVGELDGVFLVDANVDQKMLLEKADQAPDHKVTSHGAYQIHSWIDAQGKKHEHPMAGAFYKSSVLVFAPTAEQVAAALDVLDGKSPALAAAPSPLAAAAPAGTMLLIRAIGLADAKLPWKSPLVTKSETLAIAIGEQDSKTLAEAALATKSPQTAEQVKSIIDGARSMAELQHGDDPDAVKVMKMFKVSMAGKAVKIEFSGPVDEVWGAMDKAIDEVIKHRKNIEALRK